MGITSTYVLSRVSCSVLWLGAVFTRLLLAFTYACHIAVVGWMGLIRVFVLFFSVIFDATRRVLRCFRSDGYDAYPNTATRFAIRVLLGALYRFTLTPVTRQICSI